MSFSIFISISRLKQSYNFYNNVYEFNKSIYTPFFTIDSNLSLKIFNFSLETRL